MFFPPQKINLIVQHTHLILTGILVFFIAIFTNISFVKREFNFDAIYFILLDPDLHRNF